MAKLDNPKLQIDSIAVIPRKGARGGICNIGDGLSAAVAGGAAQHHFLYIGTSDGCVAQYAVAITPPSSQTSETPGQVQGAQTQKRSLDCGSKSVVVLQADFKLKEPRLIALCDGKISMLHPETLDKTSVFAGNKSLEGTTLCCVAVGSDAPRLAAIVKKQLVCYEYSEGSAVPYLSNDGQPLNVPEGVLQMAWVANSLLLATKREYYIYDVRTHQLIDQAVFDKAQHAPLLKVLGGTPTALVRLGGSGTLILWSGRGKTALDQCPRVTFSDDVTGVSYCDPFYVAHTMSGKTLLRSTIDEAEIDTQFNVGGPFRCNISLTNIAYAATAREVYVLHPSPLMMPVLGFIRLHQYDRAITHFRSCWDGPEDELDKQLRKVHFECALEAFATNDDEAAFRHFQESACEATDVISLFKELQRPAHTSPSRDRCVNSLGRRQTAEAGTQAGHVSFPGTSSAYKQLYEFLLTQRDTAKADANQEAIDYALLVLMATGKVEFSSEDAEGLFFPLNHLNFSECETFLKAKQQSQFLALLYAANNRCSEALELCRSKMMAEAAVLPLQLCENTKLIAEHLPWMVIVDPEVGIRGVCHPTKSPNAPELVLSLINGCPVNTLREYLAFVIHKQRSKDENVHTNYGLTLISILKTLKLFSGVEEVSLQIPAGTEAGLFGQRRAELLRFLATSLFYDTDQILAALVEAGAPPSSPFWEEQAIVHSRNQDHAAALNIYVYELNNVRGAEDYCIRYHLTFGSDSVLSNSAGTQGAKGFQGVTSPLASKSRAGPSGFGASGSTLTLGDSTGQKKTGQSVSSSAGSGVNELFTVLLNVLLVPPVGKPAKFPEAMKILDRHARVINPLSVLETLPNDLAVGQIAPYLRRIFQKLGHRRQLGVVMKHAAAAEKVSSEIRRYTMTRRNVVIDEDRKCVVCGKEMSGDIFAVFPNLKVVHFRCYKEKGLDPERGVPFVPTIFQGGM